MHREIVLDTETTGLNALKGDRIVEIAAVELVDHVPSGNFYHSYINPNRSIPFESTRIHKITDAFVTNKPKFPSIVKDLMSFIGGSDLIIHNAIFDMTFLQNEISISGFGPLTSEIVDTLALAKEKYPGSSVSLDSLCKRFNIDTSDRNQRGHGALIDSILLSQVYLELIGGNQPALSLEIQNSINQTDESISSNAIKQIYRPIPLKSRLSEIDRENHQKFLLTIGCEKAWKKIKPNQELY